MHKFDTLFGLNDRVWFICEGDVAPAIIVGITIYESGTYYTLKGHSSKELFSEKEFCATKEMAKAVLAAQQDRGKSSKYKPGDIVWYISGKQYWNPEYSFTHKAAKAVVLEAKDPDYTVLSVPGDCELLKGEENLYATKEEAEKVIADRIAALSHKQSRTPHVREKLDALIKKLEEEKEAWI